MQQAFKHIGILGGGPTSVYLLKELIDKGKPGLSITIINPDKIGYSTPWSEPWASGDHMANIGSEEIPDLLQPIHEWLKKKDDSWLSERGIARADLQPRGLYPRVVVGEYFNDQCAKLCERAAKKHITVTEMTHHKVIDVHDMPEQNKERVTLKCTRNGETSSMEFDTVAVATGHEWTKNKETAVKGFYETPWPVSKLAERKNQPVALMGSSLSAVDAGFELANLHGRFERNAAGKLQYIPNPGTEKF